MRLAVFVGIPFGYSVVPGLGQPPEEDFCLHSITQGCFVIKDRETCLHSRDGRLAVGWTTPKIHNEPCAWCGGYRCHNGEDTRCEPNDYLMHGGTSYPGLELGKKGFTKLYVSKSKIEVARCGENDTVIQVKTSYGKCFHQCGSPPRMCPGCASGEGFAETCCVDGTGNDICRNLTSGETHNLVCEDEASIDIRKHLGRMGRLIHFIMGKVHEWATGTCMLILFCCCVPMCLYCLNYRRTSSGASKEDANQDDSDTDDESSDSRSYLKKDEFETLAPSKVGSRGKPCNSCYSFLQLLPRWMNKSSAADSGQRAVDVSLESPSRTVGFEDSMASAQDDGCGCTVTRDSGLDANDPVQKHYKKTGLLGGITGAFGDKKTMYCHHLTGDGKFAVKEAGDSRFDSEEEVWEFLGKSCQGRFTYDKKEGCLKCGPLVMADHDRTCNVETCLFIKNDLQCPTPDWALKAGE